MKKYVEKAVEQFLVRTGDVTRLKLRRDQLLRLSRLFDDTLRKVESSHMRVPAIRSFDGRDTLRVSIMQERALWKLCPAKELEMPGMITTEESQYYTYVGRFFSGMGEAVELGPWLGRSTHYILDGLKPNSHFAGRRLHVFDDFIWRPSWMNEYVSEPERLGNHQDFRPLFDKYTADIASDLHVERVKITDYDGNESLPVLTWPDKPIEILYVDCGRTVAANEGWYAVLQKCFVPNRTLIVMQDWRMHREIPSKFFNQTKQFTDSKGAQLDLIHEVNDGGVATFLYRGGI